MTEMCCLEPETNFIFGLYPPLIKPSNEPNPKLHFHKSWAVSILPQWRMVELWL